MSREEIQSDALKAIEGCNRCGIAVSMGVGKTLIGLQHIAGHYYEELKVLVVAPKKSIFKSWLEEAKKFDSGKVQLSHIHPSVWLEIIKGSNCDIYNMNVGMNNFFYYHDARSLNHFWAVILKDWVEGMTRVLEFGAKKYASLNYAKGMEYSRVMDAFRRHCLWMNYGEYIDEESNLLHEHHMLCNMMFMTTYANTRVGIDDRPDLRFEIKEEDIISNLPNKEK
jgi:hypothetical protein